METATPKMASSPGDFDPLIKKINNEDPDIRFMVLGDLQNMLAHSSSTILRSDNKRSAQLIDALAERLDESNGDVQSQALKTVLPLASKLSDFNLRLLFEKLLTSKTKNSLDDAIFITAVRTIVTSLPRPGPGPGTGTVTAITAQASSVTETMMTSVIPRLSEGLLEPTEQGGSKPESIELAHQVIICYGVVIADKTKRHLLSKLLSLLDDSRASIIVHKRAVMAIAALAVFLPDSLLKGELVPSIIQRLEHAKLATRKMKMLLSLIGSIAQTARGRLDSSLDQLVPYIYKVASQENFDELTSVAQEEGANIQGEEAVEAALTTLEELLSSCGQAMREYIDEAIVSSTIFLSYDPNLIQEDGDDEAMEEDDAFDADEDDDFEEEAGMSDSDDVSWKVRRCGAKVLHTLIRIHAGTDLLQNGTLYERIAPTLVKRLSEREESVRLEVIASLARLVRLTGDLAGPGQEYIMASSVDKLPSRKRRRSSTAANSAKYQNLDRGATSPREMPSPTQGPQGDLAKLAPNIAQAALNVLKQKQVNSQQAAALLLKDLITVRHGRLDTRLQEVVQSTVLIAKTANTTQSGASSIPAGNAAAATGATLRIEAFRLLSAICDSHSSKSLAGQASEISSATVSAIGDAHFKIAVEATLTAESITKIMTPPRSLGATPKAQEIINQLFGALVKQVQSQSTELEVRTTAIHALGFLLARTAGHAQLLGSDERSQAATILGERLKNEVTRLSTIEAIDCIAAASIGKSDYPAEWLQSVLIELANQLRKADRALSAASLSSLHLLLSHESVIGVIDGQTSKTLIGLLLAVLDSQVASQLPLAFGCLSRIVRASGAPNIEAELIDATAKLAATPLSGHILDAYLELVEAIGSTGSANTLLGRLLKDVGVNGSPEVNGAAIGTLLASGGDGLSVKYTDIISELETATDAKRKALALAILGQFGFYKGASSPLEPSVFLQNLKDKADVARSAAIALGRAGAGNPSKYLPVILDSLRSAGEKQSVLVPALREVLSFKSQALSEASSHSDELWSVLVELSVSDDSRVVAAECVGKLVAMLPEKFIPLLQEQLSASSAEARGLVNQALRYALVNSDRHLDDALRPVIGDMLTTLLRDDATENRRLALMTLSAATSNKPALVSPYIPQLSQVVIERARIDTSLIREVAMGPFKHKVDDGLEVRKSAYETLHTLINAAYTRLDSLGVFDRVIQGLSDDNDIKALCTLLVGKLIKVDREQSARHLHQFAAMFSATLSQKLKETAVKQEIERAQEANKDVLRATAKINLAFPASSAASEVDALVWQSWQAYNTSVRKDHQTAMAMADDEVAAEQR